MHHYSRCSNEIIDVHGKFSNGSCFDNGKFNNTNGFKYLLFVNNYSGYFLHISSYRTFVTLYCSCQSIVKANCSLKYVLFSQSSFLLNIFFF